MRVYVVTKDEVPCMATFDEGEARSAFERILRSGRYRRAATLAVPACDGRGQVLMEA